MLSVRYINNIWIAKLLLVHLVRVPGCSFEVSFSTYYLLFFSFVAEVAALPGSTAQTKQVLSHSRHES